MVKYNNPLEENIPSVGAPVTEGGSMMGRFEEMVVLIPGKRQTTIALAQGLQVSAPPLSLI